MGAKTKGLVERPGLYILAGNGAVVINISLKLLRKVLSKMLREKKALPKKNKNERHREHRGHRGEKTNAILGALDVLGGRKFILYIRGQKTNYRHRLTQIYTEKGI